MKKWYFWTLLISGMFVFASCNNDDEPKGDGNVPQAVLDAFESQYGETRANWSVKDGYAIAQFNDNNGDATAWYALDKGTPASGINAWIEQNFPKARIVDVDVERNGTEVEIIHDGMKHEILFDASSNWLRTKTEYDWRNIPDGINTFVQSNHPDYHIDDVDRYETKDNIYYYKELQYIVQRLIKARKLPADCGF